MSQTQAYIDEAIVTIRDVNKLDRELARGWSCVKKRYWSEARQHANVAIGIAKRLQSPGRPEHPQLKRARKLCKHLGIRS